MLRLIFVILVIVTHKLSSELKKKSQDEKYYQMENRTDSELRIFRVYIYRFKYRIYFSISYIYLNCSNI